MSTPYYEDEHVQLWHGDFRDILPRLDIHPDLVVTDPPYGETSLDWDRWPDGWPSLLQHLPRTSPRNIHRNHRPHPPRPPQTHPLPRLRQTTTPQPETKLLRPMPQTRQRTPQTPNTQTGSSMTRRPHLLDAYSGAGGATKGYQRAGFHVTGIDIKPQPHYCGDDFHQTDAITFIREHGHTFDAIHASPPCQDHSVLGSVTGREHGTAHLLADTRAALKLTRRPWVIENVIGAPMRPDFRLCGCMFNLPGLRRVRLFETSWNGFSLIPPCYHTGHAVTVAGHGAQGNEYRDGAAPTQNDRRRAMGIDWMNRDELAQAIPPHFTEYIGVFLMAALQERAA